MMNDGKPRNAPPPRGGGPLQQAERDTGMLSGAMGARPGTAISRVETRAVTAIQVAKPRDLELVKRNALIEVGMMGDDFYYAWTVNDKNSPTGKSLIQGTSIDGAMVLWNNWGNCTYEIECPPDEETPTHWTFRATAIDWERGTATPRLFRQRKNQTAGGKMDRDRAEDIAFQIGQSKAIRNAIVHACPAWLIKEAMAAAENAAVNKYQKVPDAIWDLCAEAKKFGVTKEELMAKIGKTFEIKRHPSRQGYFIVEPGAWLPMDVAAMHAVFRAIKMGNTTADIEFRGAAPPSAPEDEPTAPAAGAQAQPAASADQGGGDDHGFAGGDDMVTQAPAAAAVAAAGGTAQGGTPDAQAGAAGSSGAAPTPTSGDPSKGTQAGATQGSPTGAAPKEASRAPQQRLPGDDSDETKSGRRR